MVTPTLIEVGVLTRPHGIRGEVKLRLHNETSDALDHARRVTLLLPSGLERRDAIREVRGGGRERIVRLEQCPSRDVAETLRGAKVLVARADLPPLEPGDYYLIDLIGAELHCDQRLVGRVTAVRADPTVDTLLVERPDGTRSELPLLDAWVGGFDQKLKVLELRSEDGFID